MNYCHVIFTQFGSHLSSGAGHTSPDIILRTVSPSLMPVKKPSFSPFCSVDQIRISIHCHVSGVNALVCVPGNVWMILIVQLVKHSLVSDFSSNLAT